MYPTYKQTQFISTLQNPHIRLDETSGAISVLEITDQNEVMSYEIDPVGNVRKQKADGFIQGWIDVQ